MGSQDNDHENSDELDHSLVELRSLHVSFQTQHVLREIDLEIPKGETIAIIGESGCGKTVLLKTIIGLVSPTLGQCLFDGQDLQMLGDAELTKQRRRFGYVFQNAALFDSLTVAQNVAFPLRQHNQGNYTDAEIQEMVINRLKEVGLNENIISKKPAQLSGGMRKRVGLARALAMSPEVILYDEPTTGLDPIMSDVINELIIKTRDSHQVTSIIVTHDMQTAQKVADRVVMLFPIARLDAHQDQVLFDGPPDQLERFTDQRVAQFVRGEGGSRLVELQENGF